jgi:hypothetical protein
VQRLHCAEDLRPETHYRVVGRFPNDTSGESEELTSFTTGDDLDTVSPADVEASVDERGLLSVSADEVIAVLDVSIDRGASSFFPIDRNGQLALPLQADANLSFVALDFAGNASEPFTLKAEIDESLFNPSPCGCSEMPSVLPMALWLTLLALPSRRGRPARRRAPR